MATKRKRSDREESWRMPAGFRPTPLPGERIWPLRKLYGERVEDAIQRAKRMWWWPTLRSKSPSWSGGHWYWIGRPTSEAGAREAPAIPTTRLSRQAGQLTKHDDSS